MKRAVVYTYSEVFSSSEAFQSLTPYVSAILKGEDGVRFPAFLVDAAGGPVEIGATAEYVKQSENNIPLYRLV